MNNYIGKKYLFFTLMTGSFIIASPNLLQAQFLKNILNTVKNTATQNVNNKAANATNKTIDKIEGAGKTKSKGTTTSSNSSNTATVADTTKPGGNNTQTQSTTANNNNSSSTAPQNNPYNSDGSFISLNLSSDRIIATGAVQITGSSVKYKNFNSVTVTIAAADGSRKESRTLLLDTSGAYSTIWQLNTDDSYIVTAKSSDGKNTVSRDLGVYKPEDIDSVVEPLKTSLTTAYDKLKEDIDKVKTTITGTDADALQKKMDDFTDKKDKVIKQLADVGNAGKGLMVVQKKYGVLPSPVLQNISDMTDEISTQTNQVEQAIAATDHKSYDNSVCEYLVMVSEACAAFSTFMSFEAKFGKTLVNLANSKVYSNIGGYAGGVVTGGSDVGKKAATECASLFLVAVEDTKPLEANFSFASFGGDIVQMCSDLLLKKYCAVMSGDLNQKYQCTYRNKSNDVWWDYTYTTEAIINLRYPKNKSAILHWEVTQL